MSWADKVRTLKVRTNADTPEDAAKAREFGAEGIGLCRTEHMFFGDQRIVAMRKMILADDEAGRKAALAELEPFQKQDFIGIFEAMDGLPVTIRLLDPPLHEFLPNDDNRRARPRSPRSSASPSRRSATASSSFTNTTRCSACAAAVCRSSYPEIGDMQVRAIIEAAIEVKKRGKIGPARDHDSAWSAPSRSCRSSRSGPSRSPRNEMKKAGVKVEYQIGTMIEVPRAALTADQIAEEAEFFSFGTNDLTQLTFGFCRDDIGSFMPRLRRAEDPAGRPVPDARRQRRRPVDRDRRRQGPQGPAREARRALEGRDLRRARRRPRQRRILPQGGHGLCFLLAVPRPDRPAGRRPGRACRRQAISRDK